MSKGREEGPGQLLFCTAKQLIAGFSSRAENRKHTMKAAALEVTTTLENSTGHFVIQREGRKRHCVQCKKDGPKDFK